MDIKPIIDFINSCGFPIACTVALFYMCNKERDAHKEETSQLAQAITELKMVMNRVLDKLDGGDPRG